MTAAELSINTLRFLAVDAVEKAASGHPGMPMGAASTAYALWTRYLKFDPAAPAWPDRDRFVLSAGHGSMLLYALLHLSGYDVTLDDLKNFRQWGSKTPGHPEYGHTPGVETTTGPLGQGLAASVGLAMAERHLAARFNRPGFPVVDHYTYTILGDGCMMEGVAAEAASLAGHLGLGKLIALYDDNHITIEGDTNLAFSEDVGARFAAYGWHVTSVADGNDVEAIAKALAEARADLSKPSLIRIRTHIGFGSPKVQDTAHAHGAPLGADEAAVSKKNLGWPVEPAFHVPDGARDPFARQAAEGAKARRAWEAMFAEYAKEFPALAADWSRRFRGELPEGWANSLPTFPADPKGMATRVAGGKVIQALTPVMPELIGGSADLAPSTNTLLPGEKDFERDSYEGRNLRFGVREHAMGAVVNGLCNHGGLRPFDATFFVFADYMRPAIRLSALMGVPAIHVMTHDSIFVGEDGPTHQPIEHLASLRAMPGLCLLRPADANETAAAWRVALERKNGPTLLVLSRQNLPTLDRASLAAADNVAKGGYVLKEAQGGAPRAILLASGSEVHVALDAANLLEASGTPTRVVNLASWDLFEAQSKEYRESVLPPSLRVRVAVEAGATLGWERYVGLDGRVVGIDRFGASAPGSTVGKQLGLTPQAVADAASALLR